MLFRSRCAGRPAGTIEYSYTTAAEVIKSFRFRTNDEYLIAVKNSAADVWRPISQYEGHYSHMAGSPNPINTPAIVTAFNTNFTQNYSDWSGKLRIICLFTAEAARSNAVYRPCQLAIHGHRSLVYNDIWRYINGYGAARTAYGLDANTFRALENEDYR